MNAAVWYAVVCAWTVGRCHYAHSAQILSLMPIAAKSHWNVVDAVLQTLVARGHNVTAVTPFPKGRNVVNYTEVDVSRLIPSGIGVPWEKVIDERTVANNIPYLSGAHRHMCKTVFEHDRFWHAIESNKYDLFITELLASSCDTYVAYHLKIPQIVVTSSHIHTWYHHTLGSHLNPAHISTFNSPFAVPSNFMQRLMNVYDYFFSHLVLKWVDWEATTIGRKYFGQDAPDADTLMSNVSLVFVNGHNTLDLPKPSLPNFVDIGGLHLAPVKPLPIDIEEFINDSPNGVVYFTLGSIIKMASTPDNLQKVFVEAFGEISQKVLWKYESENLGELPNNLKIGKWFPQRDILAHDNVKLYISHGGISGMYEAIDSGVPIIGIPVFFDQPHNIANIVHWGAGEMLDHKTLTKDKLVDTIKRMMANYDEYKSNAIELSKRFKDRPKTPQEEVVYWSEYVIKHKGARHLRSAALQLSWYQFLLIDVLISVVLILVASISVIYLILKMIKNLVLGLTKIKEKKK